MIRSQGSMGLNGKGGQGTAAEFGRPNRTWELAALNSLGVAPIASNVLRGKWPAKSQGTQPDRPERPSYAKRLAAQIVNAASADPFPPKEREAHPDGSQGEPWQLVSGEQRHPTRTPQGFGYVKPQARRNRASLGYFSGVCGQPATTKSYNLDM
jgi:hypothetical protein